LESWVLHHWWGGPPWSARDALVPLFAPRNQVLADVDGPAGGPVGKVSGIGLTAGSGVWPFLRPLGPLVGHALAFVRASSPLDWPKLASSEGNSRHAIARFCDLYHPCFQHSIVKRRASAAPLMPSLVQEARYVLLGSFFFRVFRMPLSRISLAPQNGFVLRNFHHTPNRRPPRRPLRPAPSSVGWASARHWRQWPISS